jgi:hypothetical protein
VDISEVSYQRICSIRKIRTPHEKIKNAICINAETFVVGRDFWYFKAFFPPPEL